MKKKLATKIYRTVSAYFMLLLISVTFLPISLFHHHSSDKIVRSEYNYKLLKNEASQNEEASFSNLNEENNVEECLFCAWQTAARLTYVIPVVEIFLPDFNNSRLAEQYSSSVEVLAVADIPNRGPPSFSL